MKPWLRFALLAALAAALLLWWYAPARVIERRTRALLDVISVPASAGKASRLLRSDSLVPYLAETVRFQTPDDQVNGDLDRPDITAGFGYVASAATETRFSMLEKHSVQISGDKASIRFRLDVYADLPGHTSSNGQHETRIDWIKTDDGWRVQAVELNPAS